MFVCPSRFGLIKFVNASLPSTHWNMLMILISLDWGRFPPAFVIFCTTLGRVTAEWRILKTGMPFYGDRIKFGS